MIFDSAVDGDAQSSFIVTDNKNSGAPGGKELVRLIGDKEREGDVRAVHARHRKICAALETTGGLEYYLMEQAGSRFPEFETAQRCWRLGINFGLRPLKDVLP